MSMQGAGPMTDAQIMAELRKVNAARAYPLSSNDADVLALAGKVAQPLAVPADFYGKSAGGGGGGAVFAVSAFDDANNAYSGGAAGSVACNPSVAATGGTGNYSYLWGFTSNPFGAALTNSTSAACNVRKSYAANANGSAASALQCIVTDTGTNASITKTGINALLSWNS